MGKMKPSMMQILCLALRKPFWKVRSGQKALYWDPAGNWKLVFIEKASPTGAPFQFRMGDHDRLKIWISEKWGSSRGGGRISYYVDFADLYPYPKRRIKK